MARSKIVSASITDGVVPTLRPNAQPIFFNGNMQVAQRGDKTGVANGNSDYYAADRYKFNEDGTMAAVLDVSSETLTSGNAWADGFDKALKYDVTTADASPNADTYARITQRFEKGDLQLFKKGTSNAEKYTLAFWVKATKTGTQIVELMDQVNTRHCCASYTVSSTNTWEHKVLNFPADTTGPLGTGSGLGFEVNFVLEAGTNYTSGTLATSWASQTAANIAVGQVNNFDNTSNNFHITGVQLEVGEYTSSTLPPFQYENYEENLARCQRYYYKLGPLTQDEYFGSGNIDGSNDAQIFIPFPTKMRTGPTAIETDGTASHYVIRVTSDVACDAVPVFSNTSELNAMTTFKKSSHGKTNEAGAFGRSNNDDACLAWSAEL